MLQVVVDNVYEPEQQHIGTFIDRVMETGYVDSRLLQGMYV